MADTTINSGAVADLGGLIEQREAKIAAASTDRPKFDFNANKLARSLHPDRQHFLVSAVEELQAECKCYTLVPDPDEGTDHVAYFAPGQYVTVFVDIDGVPTTRAYSISSSPRASLDGKLEITVKNTDGGFVSPWILENWKEGDKVETSGPLGEFFYISLRDAPTIVALAGGSGITPFLSMARAIAEGDEDFNLTILLGSRTEDQILYKDEFDRIQAATDKVKVVHVLSDEEKDGFEHGFLTAELIEKYAPAGEPYSVFMCGPQVMYAFADKELEKLGLIRKYIRRELFGEIFNPQDEPDWPADAEVPEEVAITVTIKGDSKTVKGSGSDSVMRILEKSGIAVPAKCRSGECGWCRSRLISGEVFMPDALDGRRMADKKYGYIHPCIAFPLSDLVLEVSPVK